MNDDTALALTGLVVSALLSGFHMWLWYLLRATGHEDDVEEDHDDSRV